MNIVICDDELIYRQSIHEKVDNWAESNDHSAAIMVYEFQSSEDMLEEWEHGLSIDMILIDIQIPNEMSGLETAKRIYSKNEHIPIVFVTNYSEYACEGYKVNALRYIRKPVRQSDIDECLNIVWRRWKMRHSNAITIYSAKQTLNLPVDTVLIIESIGHMVNITTIDEIGTYVIRSKLEPILAQLPVKLFAQCHRSYIVNVMYVRKFQNSEITMNNGVVVPIGRKYARTFVDTFSAYYRGDVD